jgi:hypothetical protein
MELEQKMEEVYKMDDGHTGRKCSDRKGVQR